MIGLWWKRQDTRQDDDTGPTAHVDTGPPPVILPDLPSNATPLAPLPPPRWEHIWPPIPPPLPPRDQWQQLPTPPCDPAWRAATNSHPGQAVYPP